MKTRDPVVFGYWRGAVDEQSDLPWPVVNQTPDQKFLARVARVENGIHRLNGRLIGYKGSTRSRLTGKLLGSQEFFITVDGTEYRWPEDYASHYLAAGVAPDPAFRTLIESLARS